MPLGLPDHKQGDGSVYSALRPSAGSVIYFLSFTGFCTSDKAQAVNLPSQRITPHAEVFEGFC